MTVSNKAGKSLKNEPNRVVQVTLQQSDDARCADFARFGDLLAGRFKQIRLRHEKLEPQARPALVLGDNIVCRFLPPAGKDRWLEAAVSRLSTVAPKLPAAVGGAAAIHLPAHVKIYVTPPCPHCPAVLEQLLALPFANPRIQITIIDAALFPELATADDIRSAPTTLLEDRFRWVGQIDPAELIQVMQTRDPSSLGAASLAALIKDGQAAEVAAMMVDHGAPFPALIDLITHPHWSIRLGAMVTLEQLAETAPGLARQAYEPLWERFHTAGDAVRGDILYLLGEIGAVELRARIQTVTTGGFSAEITETARETLEKLDQL
jgi:hypothetical protein